MPCMPLSVLVRAKMLWQPRLRCVDQASLVYGASWQVVPRKVRLRQPGGTVLRRKLVCDSPGESGFFADW